MTITPLGDQAILVDLPNEDTAIHLARVIKSLAPDWLQDVVPAYATVGIFFDADRISLKKVQQWLKDIAPEHDARHEMSRSIAETRLRIIPVCYEMQLDHDRVLAHTGLTREQMIQLHTSTLFTVYAIGFVPGFPYLGYLPVSLCGVNRLPSPRLRVEPGSVGLTGKQTGIYPLPRPGGWNIIGRTPLEIVNVAEGYFPLRVGDQVRFARIDEREFQNLAGERL